MEIYAKIRSVLHVSITFLFSFMLFLHAGERVKPRVIATTDGEDDDRSSMVRFLMYASDYDIAGIVQVNGVQKSGHSKAKWVEKIIENYAECYPNLIKHDPNFPTKEYLLSVVKVGNENSGDLGKAPPLLLHSEGAQLIMDVLMDNDPRPVHILAWGGANTQANALWQIKEKHPDKWEKAAAKARLYCIWFQDGGGKWVVNNLPEVKIYGAGVSENSYSNNNASWRGVWDYMSVAGRFKGRPSNNPKEIQVIMDTDWWNENIGTGHGLLAASYNKYIIKWPQNYTSEGDSPSFMPLVNNGLEQHTDYTLGGWGGRPVYKKGNLMLDGADKNNGKDDYHYTFYRWLPAAQNDWASRADWCVVSKFEDANHQPNAVITGGNLRKVNPGATVNLDASQTTDPDGNTLSFKWWQYHEADNANAVLDIKNSTSKDNASFVVPNELNKELHIILEVTDNGEPPLTRYQRAIFQITNDVVSNQNPVPTFTVNPGLVSTNLSQGVLSIANLQLAGKTAHGEILDVSGKTIMNFNLNPELSSHQIDMSGVASGTYVMSIRIGLTVISKVLFKATL